jgi:parallel beta-helix repeat protein
MTLDDARRILGLGVDEDPAPHLKDFTAARDRIAELVSSAPNAVIADRYRAGLTEFEEALAVVRLHLARVGSAPTEGESSPPTEPNPLVTEPPVEEGQPVEPAIFGEPVVPIMVESTEAHPQRIEFVENAPPTPEIVTPPGLEVSNVETAKLSEATPSGLTPTKGYEAPMPPSAGGESFSAAESEKDGTWTPLREQPRKPFAVNPATVIAATEGFLPSPGDDTSPVEADSNAPVPSESQPKSEEVESLAEKGNSAAAVTPTTKLTGPEKSLAPTKKLEAVEEALKAAPSRKGRRFLIFILVVLLLAVLGGWIYLLLEQNKRVERQSSITDLEKEGATLIEGRRWQEAREVYEKIEAIDPGSEVAAYLRRSIADGIEEEQQQFLQYWNGEALAAFESDRLDVAAAAIEQVFSKFPNDPTATELRGKIEEARKVESLRLALEEVKKKLDARDWDGAISEANGILASAPDHAEAKALLEDATSLKSKEASDLARAQELFAQASSRDQGTYDVEALEWMREAALLAPGDAAIKALLEKFSSYTRTLQVPGEFATPAEALAVANERDRIVIAEGTWQGPLSVNIAVELQGAGSGKTIFACEADKGPAISFGPGAKGVRVTGMTFKHTTLDPGAERYSTVLLRGATVAFADCHFIEGAGHGLAVIDGGAGSASHCRFADNGWDGACASGVGSSLHVSDSEAAGNLEHGLDVWGGATGSLINNRSEGNSRNGIHVEADSGEINVTGNQARGNREFGIVLTKGSTGQVAGNVLTDNLMGGMVIRAAASQLAVTGNRIQSNSGPGLALEKGVVRAGYEANEITTSAGNPMVKENLDFEEQVKIEE